MRSIIIPKDDLVDALRSTEHLTHDDLALLAQLICVRLRSRSLVTLAKHCAKANEQLALGLSTPSLQESAR